MLVFHQALNETLGCKDPVFATLSLCHDRSFVIGLYFLELPGGPNPQLSPKHQQPFPPSIRIHNQALLAVCLFVSLSIRLSVYPISSSEINADRIPIKSPPLTTPTDRPHRFDSEMIR